MDVNKKLKPIKFACCMLTVYHNITHDPQFKAFYKIIRQLICPDHNPYHLLYLYNALLSKLAGNTCSENPWQDYLIRLILNDENPFTRSAAEGIEIPPALRTAVKNDLGFMQLLFKFDLSVIYTILAAEIDVEPVESGIAGWLAPDKDAGGPDSSFNEVFFKCPDWRELWLPLRDYHRRAGCGLMRRFPAFRWDKDLKRLCGVINPDPVRLSDLIGYEAQKQIIQKNTEQFLAGSPANNILLYGERGTGKSSTVKALANEYGHLGLRLIEMTKHDLADFLRLAEILSVYPNKFILYIDDLSFDEGETGYKDLKGILEGDISARPDNILLYATSNRRHLIKERFSDQDFSDDELHIADTREEKLSLADRFGITVTFLTPDQDNYLRIVEGLARQRGLHLSTEELHRRALQWERRHNGRSGRSARQFVDQLEGEIKYLEKNRILKNGP